MALRISSPRPPVVALHLEGLETREVPAAIAALDPSFGNAGKVLNTGAPLTGVALQTDGKIVVVGTALTDFYVARYNPNGSLDTTFDGDGVKTIDFLGTDHANAVAIQPDGKIVVVGSTSTNDDVAVARLLPTGALDTTFNGTGKLTIDLNGTAESGNAVAIQPDGNIVIAGTTGSDFGIMRVLGSNGTMDSTFGFSGEESFDLGGTADAANAVAIQADGQIVVAGTDLSTGGIASNFAVIRLNKGNGTPDTTFNSNGKLLINMGGVGIARGLAIQSDTKIVVVGSNGSDFAIARINAANGSLDTTFDTDGKQTVDISGADDARAVQLQPDGKILVVGDTGNNASDTAVVRLTTAGALDTTFNTTGKFSFDVSGTSFLDLGTAAVLGPQGRLVIAGQGGGSQVNGSVVRVPVELEDDRNLAVGGSTNGQAKLYVPNVATPATIAAFGTTSVNVRVAIGDVNGDGFEDTVLVTGPGTPIRLAVVSGKDNTTLLVSPMDPFGGNFTGGGFVSTGDFDNDGRSEVIVTPDLGGGPRVAIYSLSAAGAFTARANFFGIDDPNFRGGVRTAAGDINADGVADLAVAAGFQGGPRVAVYDGKTIFGSQTELIHDFYAFDPSLRNGAFVTIGDVDGDGYGDLFFGAGAGGSPRVLGVSGKLAINSGIVAAIAAPISNFFVAGDQTDRGGVHLSTEDIDGDGKADLVAGTGEGQASFVRVYFGKNVVSPSEPTGFQDLDPFSGAVLANGVFVG